MTRYCAIKIDGVGSVLEKSKFRRLVFLGGQHCNRTQSVRWIYKPDALEIHAVVYSDLQFEQNAFEFLADE